MQISINNSHGPQYQFQQAADLILSQIQGNINVTFSGPTLTFSPGDGGGGQVVNVTLPSSSEQEIVNTATAFMNFFRSRFTAGPTTITFSADAHTVTIAF